MLDILDCHLTKISVIMLDILDCHLTKIRSPGNQAPWFFCNSGLYVSDMTSLTDGLS
jgi:hypothetical protein